MVDSYSFFENDHIQELVPTKITSIMANQPWPQPKHQGWPLAGAGGAAAQGRRSVEAAVFSNIYNIFKKCIFI